MKQSFNFTYTCQLFRRDNKLWQSAGLSVGHGIEISEEPKKLRKQFFARKLSRLSAPLNNFILTTRQTYLGFYPFFFLIFQKIFGLHLLVLSLGNITPGSCSTCCSIPRPCPREVWFSDDCLPLAGTWVWIHYYPKVRQGPGLVN